MNEKINLTQNHTQQTKIKPNEKQKNKFSWTHLWLWTTLHMN